jgi:DNA modification methylase
MIDEFTPVSFRELCPEISGTQFSTHGLYSYPAQLIPQIPYYFLQNIEKRIHDSFVLDPFCGTATVMIEAMHSGWNSIGIEINPVTALAAKVKITPLKRVALEDTFRLLKRLYRETQSRFYDLPSFENLSYWFTEKTIMEMAKIRSCIQTITDDDIRDFFKATFASIIKDASRADSKIYVPVLPKKGLRKRKPSPWKLFKLKSQANIQRMQNFEKTLGKNKPKCQIICKDFIELERTWQDIEIIISSPPYISAQKYVRSTRLEAYWLGFTKEYQLDINRKTIGTERMKKSDCLNLEPTGIEELDQLLNEVHVFDPIRAGITNKYFLDMKKAIKKMYAVLSSGGSCILIIGNSTLRGRKIRTNEFIKTMCEDAGFKLEKIMLDKIVSKGLMTKRNKTAGSIDYEWVLEMRK